jgi:hypothetical protein
MDTSHFWNLIEKSREASQGDPDDQLAQLETLLGELEPEQLVEFDRLFSKYHNEAYTWPLWGAAYIIGGGCSDDGFMDFRGWLIARGQQVYEAALASPDSLAEVVSVDDECQVEGFQYLPRQVWAEATGRDESEFPAHDIAYRAEPEGTQWEEDDPDALNALLPKLAKKFG